MSVRHSRSLNGFVKRTTSFTPTTTVDFRRSEDGSSIFVSNGDTWAVHSIQAEYVDDDVLNIVRQGSGEIIYKEVRFDQVTISGASIAVALAGVVECNVLFDSSGATAGELPVITSSLTTAIVEGETLNYELTAQYGVGYEWSGLPSGLVTEEGNVRRLIGGSLLAAGTYNLTATAINYNGQDAETIVLTVSNPPFADTKSICFDSGEYLQSTVSTTPMARTGDGSGASESWSLSFWFKSGEHTGGAKQTIFYNGTANHDNQGHLWVYYKGSDQKIYCEYGSKNDCIKFTTSSAAFLQDEWEHVMISYDGTSTDDGDEDAFTIHVDGSSVTLSTDTKGSGWPSSVTTSLLRLGRRGGGNDYLKENCKIDEVAMWDSTQVSNIASIYNSGDTLDLGALGTPPTNWWRMGDGDSFATLMDGEGSSDLTMTNMTAANIVSDTP